MVSTSLPLTWTPGRSSMTPPCWTLAYLQIMWYVETVRSSTMATLFVLSSSQSQVGAGDASVIKNEFLVKFWGAVLTVSCCSWQWLPGVHCSKVTSMSSTRFDFTGARRTREDQSILSTSRLSLWRWWSHTHAYTYTHTPFFCRHQ